MLNTCDKLLFVLIIKKIVAPVVNERSGKHYVTVFALLVTADLNVHGAEKLLHTVDRLITVKLVTVNEISKRFSLNNLEIVLVVVVSTGSAVKIGFCSFELTHVYTAVSNAVFNCVCERAVVVKGPLLIYVHIEKRKETFICGVALFKRFSYRGDFVLCYKKARVLCWINFRESSAPVFIMPILAFDRNASDRIAWGSEAVFVRIVFNLVFENRIDFRKAF